MATANPTKRRRVLRRPLAGNNETSSPSPLSRPLIWPPNELPVEIFDAIAEHLPRSSVQSMRLVSREFESKVSTYLFRTVVVPFRPEIYGLLEESPGEREDGRGLNVMLRDKGMRVFQGFGKHISRFAMSFEIDHTTLARPPQKSEQEAITTFWGIYRWPFANYNRFHTLEGLEQTADETRTMAKALKFITKAKELGLSIDGGLGWLSGPDVVEGELSRLQLPVFGPSRFVAESSGLPTVGTQASEEARTSSSHIGALPSVFNSNPYVDTSLEESYQRMLAEAGFAPSDLTGALHTIRESEGLSGPLSQITYTDLRDDTHPNLGLSHSSSSGSSATNNYFQQLDARYPDNGAARSSRVNGIQVSRSRFIHGDGSSHERGHSYHLEKFPLKPNSLTHSQMEMLLEIEWAQRAFMQSWTIAIVDNSVAFANITTLTIARLPSRHLNILRRNDFWHSLQRIERFSLAIIPDWREVAKTAAGFVDDTRLKPTQAVTSVYELLREQIAPRKTITELHFEWLCGGEAAGGLFARNQHVLPAPLVARATDMVTRVGQTPSLLSLPHIRTLSLKNCWASPHIFEQFVSINRSYSLQTLELTSFSLCVSVPPNANPQPGPHHGGGAGAAQLQQAQLNLLAPFQAPGFLQAAAPNALQNMVNQAQVPMIPQHPDPSVWLTVTRQGSWPWLIDHITPSRNLEDKRFSREMGPEPRRRPASSLKSITFRSCGYVKLPVDLDQSILEDPAGGIETSQIMKRRSDLETHMMKSNDHMLGTIVNYIPEDEYETIYHAWSLETGWDAAILERNGTHAIADGVREPGKGRFKGILYAKEDYPTSSEYGD